MFEGMGKIGFRTLGNDKLYAPRANSFTLTLENTQQEAKAWSSGSCGPAQTVDKVTSDSTWTLRVGTSSFDKLDISFMMDEIISTSPTAVFPQVQTAVVPADLTLTVTGLVANQDVAISVDDWSVATRLLTQVTGAAPGPNEFAVTADTITFNAAESGKPIVFIYDKTYTSSETIGLETNFSRWGSVCFTGVACGPRFPQAMQIFVPSLTRTGNFDFSLSGGNETTVELEFTPTVIAPYRKPVLVRF